MPLILPPADEDPIIRLHDYYFQATDVMYDHVEKLFTLFEKTERFSNANIVKLQSFVQVWLATLYVVGEGFQCERVVRFFDKLELEKMNEDDLMIQIHWTSIHHKLSQLGDQLRAYRNVTFHFQETMTRLEARRASFLQYDGLHRPLDWARGLHQEIKMFFQLYRPRAAFFYMHKQA